MPTAEDPKSRKEKDTDRLFNEIRKEIMLPNGCLKDQTFLDFALYLMNQSKDLMNLALTKDQIKTHLEFCNACEERIIIVQDSIQQIINKIIVPSKHLKYEIINKTISGDNGSVNISDDNWLENYLIQLHLNTCKVCKDDYLLFQNSKSNIEQLNNSFRNS